MLIACYKPPHAENEEKFFMTLDKKVKDMEEGLEDTFIIGDLNFDLLGEKTNKLVSFM